MSKYTTRPGDTFELVSRRVFGETSRAADIKAANPGVEDPMLGGLVLSVPTPLTAAPTAGLPEDVAVFVDGKEFRFWESITLRRAIDAPDAVSLVAPFDSAVSALRPLRFHDCAVSAGGDAIFTGTVVDVAPAVSDDARVIDVSAYSRPGVLFDCNTPPGLYPQHELNGLTLAGIAATLCAPFGVAVTVRGSSGAPFEQAAIEPDQTIGDFLADLARQRGLVLASGVDGSLLIWKESSDDTSRAVLSEGAPPLVEISAAFAPQSYYSSVTGIVPADVNGGSRHTVINPSAAGILRPYVFVINDGEDGDAKAATEAKAGRMFAAAASYRVTVSTWRDGSGALWAPNTRVTVTAPGAFINAPYSFLVRAVEFVLDGEGERATLELVTPGAFSGRPPERVPWG